MIDTRRMIEHGQKISSGVVASILALFTLLFGASGVFGELRDALNKMWDVKPQKGSGLWGMVKEQPSSKPGVTGKPRNLRRRALCSAVTPS